jgi:hypothetical protein
MQRQPQQGENSILDLLVIDLHAGNIPCAQAKILWPSPDAYEPGLGLSFEKSDALFIRPAGAGARLRPL